MGDSYGWISKRLFMGWDKAMRQENRNINMTSPRFKEAMKAEKIEHYPFRWGIDFYHHYKEDLALFEEMGMKIFRTSINWARIYPNGDDELPNEEGIRFYIDLFTECHKRGMKVFAAILHYNIPVNLVTKYGGWKNRKVIDFYERCCLIKDQEENYEQAIFQCTHHQFLANARAVKAAHELLPGSMVGGMIARFTSYPATCRPGDVMQSILDENYKNYFYTDVMARGKYSGFPVI